MLISQVHANSNLEYLLAEQQELLTRQQLITAATGITASKTLDRLGGLYKGVAEAMAAERRKQAETIEMPAKEDDPVSSSK